MSTTLANAMIELSKQMGDYHSSTTTSNGASGGTTVVDTGLAAKYNDWINRTSWTRIIDGTTSAGDERKASSLDATGSTLTTLAHTGQILSGTAYEVHRLFTATEKARALIWAARNCFPSCFSTIRDETLTAGNWLRNGDMEVTSAATGWSTTGLTVARNTTMQYVKRGSSSLAMSAATGNVAQGTGNNSLMWQLLGKSVTFTAWVWASTASQVRLRIYDGTTTTNSSYHTGGSIFEKLSVTASISSTASQVTFSIRYDSNASTAYVDDLRVVGPTVDRFYIGDLGLAQDRPHEIFQTADDSVAYEPWERLWNWEVGTDRYLYLPVSSQGYRLRVVGIGYLDFLLSGSASSDWTATIVVDKPQLDIVVAEAICYLYQQMLTPEFGKTANEAYAGMLNFWKNELAIRKSRYAMTPPPATASYGWPGRRNYKSRYGMVNY